MLRDIPQNDREQFNELGEGFVYMPLSVMNHRPSNAVRYDIVALQMRLV